MRCLREHHRCVRGGSTARVARMPLEHKRRLGDAAKIRIRHLIRGFYNRLLVEPIPDRLLAIIKEGAVREQGDARRS